MLLGVHESANRKNCSGGYEGRTKVKGRICMMMGGCEHGIRSKVQEEKAIRRELVLTG